MSHYYAPNDNTIFFKIVINILRLLSVIISAGKMNPGLIIFKTIFVLSDKRFLISYCYITILVKNGFSTRLEIFIPRICVCWMKCFVVLEIFWEKTEDKKKLVRNFNAVTNRRRLLFVKYFYFPCKKNATSVRLCAPIYNTITAMR